jgi:hypothetical protein
MTGDVPRPAEPLGVSGDELLVFSRCRRDAEADAPVAVLVDNEPREVLLADEKASVRRAGADRPQLLLEGPGRCSSLDRATLVPPETRKWQRRVNGPRAARRCAVGLPNPALTSQGRRLTPAPAAVATAAPIAVCVGGSRRNVRKDFELIFERTATRAS